MNATRAAAWSRYRTEPAGYRTEPSGDLRENLRDRTEEPTRFRPDLRVVYRAGGRVAAPVAPPVAAAPVAAPITAPPAAPPVAMPPGIRPSATASSKASRLRLTRRGRIVVTAMVALLAAGLSLAIAGAAQATGHSASQRTGPSLAQVVVRPGQTLWSVAENADPNSDPRQVIQQIAQLNALTSGTLMAGQRLWVPRG
jgi:LysM repeat protein